MTFRRTRCPHCKGKLEQGQRIHPGCIDGYAEAQAAKVARAEEKKARMAAKVERAETRRRKEALKTVPDLIKEAQIAFNAFIRERDRQAGHMCISSGRPLDWSGNAVDAGHYRSTGAASHLRFHEDNCHAQSKHDNQFLAGNAVDYRIRLVARIGLARVEALEADNQVRKWSRQELIEIRETYKTKLKQLKEKAKC
ncbi:recombination protein NinG [Comamonas terrigena]|uniref:recombination protein NinG n=1 Tax=Comamonas terrigena TaxID=32013 RepID=UPI00289D2CD3|nr:recombination protein NinG [Comamonas terrigena]